MSQAKKKYYGRQTELALKHFSIGDEVWSSEVIRALALVKIASAKTNAKLKKLDSKRAHAIVKAAHEIVDGKHADQFPLSIWQSGSGTQFNMSVNEVIASRANEILTGQADEKNPIHPNDHVNMSQSTNDTVPTAIHVALLDVFERKLHSYTAVLLKTLQKKSREFKSLKKIGRTHLQDAVELSLGDVFSGYAANVEYALKVIDASATSLYEVPFGGTAVGTGLNTPRGFQKNAVRELARLSKLPLVPSRNTFADQSAHVRLVAFSGALKTLAVTLMKIADDVRLLASGPHAGIGELMLPKNEPGSSIMPGKVNPTQCEALIMVAADVIGVDTTLTIAETKLANFEMQAAKPLFASRLLRATSTLADAVRSFEMYALRGVQANRDRIEINRGHSLEKLTRESAVTGFDKAVGKKH